MYTLDDCTSESYPTIHIDNLKAKKSFTILPSHADNAFAPQPQPMAVRTGVRTLLLLEDKAHPLLPFCFDIVPRGM